MRWTHYVSGMLGRSVGINQSPFHNDPDPVRQVLGSAPFTDEWVWPFPPNELLVRTESELNVGTWLGVSQLWQLLMSGARHPLVVGAGTCIAGQSEHLWTLPDTLLAASIPGVWPSELSPDTAQCPWEDKITHSWETPCCVWSLSRGRPFATPWTAACLASLSITNSWSSLRLMYIQLVMPSSHLILCTAAPLPQTPLLSITWLCSGPVSPHPTPSLTGSFPHTLRGKSPARVQLWQTTRICHTWALRTKLHRLVWHCQ